VKSFKNHVYSIKRVICQRYVIFYLEIQMEILIRRSEQSPVVFEKCQYMLLLVKLYPETVNQHGVTTYFQLFFKILYLQI